MEQITTKHVGEWGSTGYTWKQGADGGWMCVEVPEMTDRNAPECSVEALKLVQVKEQM